MPSREKDKKLSYKMENINPELMYDVEYKFLSTKLGTC